MILGFNRLILQIDYEILLYYYLNMFFPHVTTEGKEVTSTTTIKRPEKKNRTNMTNE
jgi:hypothetical protein